MKSHRSKKLILLLTPCIAAAATVILSVPPSAASAVVGGATPRRTGCASWSDRRAGRPRKPTHPEGDGSCDATPGDTPS